VAQDTCVCSTAKHTCPHSVLAHCSLCCTVRMLWQPPNPAPPAVPLLHHHRTGVCCVGLPCHLMCLQVRAEHRAEHDIFRSILLGHSSTPTGPVGQQQAHQAAGGASSSGAGSMQPRLFMQQKSV
jgi:hypothetical protein